MYLTRQPQYYSLTLTTLQPTPQSTKILLSPPLTLPPFLTPSTLSRSSPHSACGIVWTCSPTHLAGLATSTPHQPAIHWHGMGAAQSNSHHSPVGCWSTPPSGLSPSVTWDSTRRVPPPRWPVPVHSLCYPRHWVPRWRAQVGVGSGGALVVALCSGNRRPKILSGRRRLASLSRKKGREKKEKPRTVMTNADTQLESSPQPSTILRGNKIRMSSLDTSHRKFQSHPKTSFSINGRWSIKWIIHKSISNKVSIVQRTWRIFYNTQNNQLAWTISYTHPYLLQQPSTNLPGDQIHMSGFNMAHRQFTITPVDKYWYQWTMILSTRTNNYKIKEVKIKTRTPKNNNS